MDKFTIEEITNAKQWVLTLDKESRAFVKNVLIKYLKWSPTRTIKSFYILREAFGWPVYNIKATSNSYHNFIAPCCAWESIFPELGDDIGTWDFDIFKLTNNDIHRMKKTFHIFVSNAYYNRRMNNNSCSCYKKINHDIPSNIGQVDNLARDITW
jgi:hypothetical protein